MRIHHVHRKRHVKCVTVFSANSNTVKPLNSGQLQVLKKLPVIKRCPLLGGSLTKIVTSGIKHFSTIQGMCTIGMFAAGRFHCIKYTMTCHKLFSGISLRDSYNLRSKSDFTILQIRAIFKGSNSISYYGPIILSLLPEEIRYADSP